MLKLALLLLVATATALHLGKPDTDLVEFAEKPKKHHRSSNKKHHRKKQHKKHKKHKVNVEMDDDEVCNKINHEIGGDKARSTMMEKCSEGGTHKSCEILQSGKPSEKKAEASTHMKQTYGKCLADMGFKHVPKDCVDDMADGSVEMFCDRGMALSPSCEAMAHKVIAEKNSEIEACGKQNNFKQQLHKAIKAEEEDDDDDAVHNVCLRLMETCVHLTPECNDQYSYVVATNGRSTAAKDREKGVFTEESLQAFANQMPEMEELFKKPAKPSSADLLKSALTHGSVASIKSVASTESVELR